MTIEETIEPTLSKEKQVDFRNSPANWRQDSVNNKLFLWAANSIDLRLIAEKAEWPDGRD